MLNQIAIRQTEPSHFLSILNKITHTCKKKKKKKEGTIEIDEKENS